MGFVRPLRLRGVAPLALKGRGSTPGRFRKQLFHPGVLFGLSFVIQRLPAVRIPSKVAGSYWQRSVMKVRENKLATIEKEKC